MALDLSIVIPVFNNINYTKACLEDLVKLPNTHEIIIVDNGSTDSTKEECLGFQQALIEAHNTNLDVPQLRYFQHTENLGFAKGCNFGYLHSLGRNVLFLNNDIRVKENFSTWTQGLIDQEGLVGPTGGLLDSRGNFVKELAKIEQGNFYMSGWCLAAKKTTWNNFILPGEVGPFSSEFGLAFFEDTDLGFRATRAGVPCQIVPVPVVHFGHMTAKKIGTSKLYAEAQKVFKKKWNL